MVIVKMELVSVTLTKDSREISATNLVALAGPITVWEILMEHVTVLLDNASV